MRKRVIVWLTMQGKVKLALFIGMAAVLLVILTYRPPVERAWSSWSLPLSGKTIAIDAGHGGPDGGAVSKEGLLEKEVNLAISLYLRDYLQQAGAIVVMTREIDADLAKQDTKGLSKRKTEDLYKRVAMIQEKNANLVVSIHLNSFPSAQWKGAQTFYYPNHSESPNLAALIQDELKRVLENTDRVSKRIDGEVFLLKSVKLPAALVEVGFLSNPEEARNMSQPIYQRKAASAIYQGILRFYAGEKFGTI